MLLSQTKIPRVPVKRVLRWGLGLFLIYAVVRLSIVIGVPKFFPNEAYVEQVKAICVREKALCISTYSEKHVVGPWWGMAVALEAAPGKAKQLREIVNKETLPADAKNRWGPWKFVGVVVQDAQPETFEASAQKTGKQAKP